MKWFNGLAGAALLLAGSLVQAEGIGYDQVDLSYRVMDRDRADTLDDTFDGPAVRFSLGITDSIYGVIENAYLKSHGPDVDIADLAIGLGYRQALAPDMDFIGEAAWMRRDVDAPSRVDDRKDDGYQFAAGVRYLAMEMLELNVTVALSRRHSERQRSDLASRRRVVGVRPAGRAGQCGSERRCDDL